jgi:hypothetical protein
MPEFMMIVMLIGAVALVYNIIYFAVKHAINDSVLGKNAQQLTKQNDKQ